MSFHNTAAAVAALTEAPLECRNEVLKTLEYLHEKSAWVRIDKLTDVWVIRAVVPDNTLARFEHVEVGFVLLRTKQVFIRGELFNRHETHHQDECNIILGLMAKIQPDLYEDVIKALPDPVVW